MIGVSINPSFIEQLQSPATISLLIRVALILIIGIPFVHLLKKLSQRLTRGKLSLQSEQLIVRTVFYVSVIVLVMTVLNEFGFKLSALLGVAGVLGVAISFASQTSVSNIISGIFLISEKHFVIGDTVQVGLSTGTVSSIDLLSIKIRTADNKYVRIPNETMIKSEVINITHFPIRRVNIELLVPHSEDLTRVTGVLKVIAQESIFAHKDKEPLILFKEYGTNGIQVLYGVWADTKQVVELQNELMLSIQSKFIDFGIKIPYHGVRIYRESDFAEG